MLFISWCLSNPGLSYPPNVNEDQSISRSQKFVQVKLSTFEVFMVIICVTKSSNDFLKRGKTETELFMFLFIIVADAICLLTAVAHAPFFFLHHYY